MAVGPKDAAIVASRENKIEREDTRSLAAGDSAGPHGNLESGASPVERTSKLGTKRGEIELAHRPNRLVVGRTVRDMQAEWRRRQGREEEWHGGKRRTGRAGTGGRESRFCFFIVVSPEHPGLYPLFFLSFYIHIYQSLSFSYLHPSFFAFSFLSHFLTPSLRLPVRYFNFNIDFNRHFYLSANVSSINRF